MNDMLIDLAQVEGWLQEFRTILDSVTMRLAACCECDGRLDPVALDAEQVSSYELAWTAAELLAAESGIRAIAALDDIGSVNDRLVKVYVAEAIASIANRLSDIMLEKGFDDAALQELVQRKDVRAFRRAVMDTSFLAETARLMAASPADIAMLSKGGIFVDDEVAIIQDVFVKFAQDVVAPQAEMIHRQDLTVPEQELLQPMREMGVFGLSIPERFGGSAPDDRENNLSMVLVTEALSEASLAAAGSLITRPEILSRALMSGGTELQQKTWLPQIAKGDPLCAIAITEPDYGSDVASVVLRGTKTEGGWLLNGSKTWCTFAGKAGLIMVVTRTDPDKSKGYKGLSLLLVEKPSFEGHEFDFIQEGGGRVSGRAIPTIGYRGMHSFDLSFEDFFVPDQNVIGEEGGIGKGFYYTMSGMIGGRMQTAARACGVMRAALLAGLQYASDRKVFASPLIEFPLTGARLTKMAARYTVSRMLAYTVARIVDGGGGRMEASLVKLFACRNAESITRDSLQIHGGMGYAEEMPISRYFVDARVLSIFEGAEETLALKVIARSMLEESIAGTGRG